MVLVRSNRITPDSVILSFSLLLPCLAPFSRAVVARGGSAGKAFAWAHLRFNVAVGAIIILWLPIVEHWPSRRFRVPAAPTPRHLAP